MCSISSPRKKEDMSNCKQVYIEGYMDVGHRDDDLYRALGQMSMPQHGLKIQFQGGIVRKPNKWGGITQFHHFVIGGNEAVSWRYLNHLVKLIKKNGWVTRASAQDTEERSAPVSLVSAP